MMIGVGIVIGLLFGGLIGFACGAASSEAINGEMGLNRDLALMARKMLAPGNMVQWKGSTGKHTSRVVYYDQDKHLVVVEFAGSPIQITYDQLRGHVLAKKGDLEKL